MKLPTSDELAESAPAANAPVSELQCWMMDLLRHKKGLATSERMRAAASVHFGGNDRLSPAEQIDIYRQQFWLRHTSILIDDFPGLSWLLGQKRWEIIVESYLSEQGYQFFALSDLGSAMPEHLEAMLDLEPSALYVDMARLECAYEAAFSVANDEVLSPERLASIPAEAWAAAKFQTSHSLHLLDLSYPVARLRRQIQKSPESVKRDQLPQAESTKLVVYRREQTLYDKVLSPAAFLLLAELQKGTPLVEACETVVAKEPEATELFNRELSSWFGLWGRLGWITDVLI